MRQPVRPGAVVLVFVVSVAGACVVKINAQRGTARASQQPKPAVQTKAAQKENEEQKLRQAAQGGDANAQFELALMYLAGDKVAQDVAEAVKWWRQAAEQGHAAAQFNLGVAYTNGAGIVQDYAEAVRWYRRAAEQGHAGAQTNLGLSYMNGIGVAQDYTQAAEWYGKAAAQEFAGAQFDLGLMYAVGEGGAQNYVEAHKWLTVAAAGASIDRTKEYAEARDQVAAKMTRAQVAEAQKRARDWMEAFERRKR